jgi:hypothetical protein
MLHAKAAIRSRKPTLYPAELRDKLMLQVFPKRLGKVALFFLPFRSH